jgi:hypothetical protein
VPKAWSAVSFSNTIGRATTAVHCFPEPVGGERRAVYADDAATLPAVVAPVGGTLYAGGRSPTSRGAEHDAHLGRSLEDGWVVDTRCKNVATQLLVERVTFLA